MYLRARAHVSHFADMESIPATTTSPILLANRRRCSCSMAAMTIDHVASLKVPYHLYPNQLLPFSPRHSNPIVLSGSARGRPSASPIIQ